MIQAWESGSKRDRETAAKEIDKLRGTIQTLTRTTNPLGKLLDYVQVIRVHSFAFLHFNRCLFTKLNSISGRRRNDAKRTSGLEKAVSSIERTTRRRTKVRNKSIRNKYK